MLLPMLVACFAAMLVPTLLRNAPLCESLREYAARRKVWSLEVEGVSSARLTPETVRHLGQPFVEPQDPAGA